MTVAGASYRVRLGEKTCRESTAFVPVVALRPQDLDVRASPYVAVLLGVAVGGGRAYPIEAHSHAFFAVPASLQSEEALGLVVIKYAWIPWVEADRVEVAILSFADAVPVAVHRAVLQSLAVVLHHHLQLQV